MQACPPLPTHAYRHRGAHGDICTYSHRLYTHISTGTYRRWQLTEGQHCEANLICVFICSVSHCPCLFHTSCCHVPSPSLSASLICREFWEKFRDKSLPLVHGQSSRNIMVTMLDIFIICIWCSIVVHLHIKHHHLSAAPSILLTDKYTYSHVLPWWHWNLFGQKLRLNGAIVICKYRSPLCVSYDMIRVWCGSQHDFNLQVNELISRQNQ